MVKLSGLWVNTYPDGGQDMTGNFGNGKLVLRKNKFKSKPNDPDYILYLREKQPKADATIQADDILASADISSDDSSDSDEAHTPGMDADE